MRISVMIGFVVILLCIGFPLRKEKNRTKRTIRRAIVQSMVVVMMILAVTVFQLHMLYVGIVGILLLILAIDTIFRKKILLILIIGCVIIVSTGYFTLRDSAYSVLNHLENNPDTSSLYIVEDGEVLVDYEADEVRPLASIVKIVIAITYAEAVEDGILDPEERVPLADVNQYYMDGTDGGAHRVWLQSVPIVDETVSLHDVAKGMMTNSSNANTDYLLDLLGIDRVNDVLSSLELPLHDPIYPIVGGLFVSYSLDKELSIDDQVEELEAMGMDEYRNRAIDMHMKMKEGQLPMEGNLDLPLPLRKVWSDRLPGAPASVYGDLLGRISNDGFTDQMNDILHDLMEWPLQLYPENRKLFTYHGSKGGSTGFILNDAAYAELPDGSKVEVVLLIDDLSSFQQIYLEQSFGSFKSKVLLDKDFRRKVQERLE